MENKKSVTWITRLIAVVLCLFITIGLLALAFGLITLVPIASGLWLKDVVGIQIEQGITVSSFPVSELIVLTMVWFLPSLAIVGVILMIIKKVFHLAWIYIKRVLLKAFARRADAGKEQKQDEYSVTG